MAEKKLPPSVEVKRTMIERDHPDISIRRQCEFMGLNRSTLYYRPAGETALNLHLMRLIDEQYLKTPFYGWPRMTAYLRREGYAVNPKWVAATDADHGLAGHLSQAQDDCRRPGA